MRTPVRLPGVSAPRLAGIILTGLAACSIIDDSDIQSSAGFETLKLDAIEIVQTINDPARISNGSGNILITKTTRATVTADSTFAGNPEVARIVWLDLPPLNNYKLKFRSGYTGASKLIINYTAVNKPYTMAILNQSEEIVEIYRFRYNTAGKLALFISKIYGVSGDTTLTRDSIIYNNNGSIVNIIRNGSETATLQYGTEGPYMYVSKINYATGEVMDREVGNCPNLTSNYYCTGYRKRGTSTFNDPLAGFSLYVDYDKAQQVDITDMRFNSGSNTCSDCGRELDRYYLHPTMLLANELQHGPDLFAFYLIDWWIPGVAQVESQSLSGNEDVLFKFVYRLPGKQPQ